MDREWNDSQPIYRQLRDRIVAMILDGLLMEGDPLPSVRNVAAEYRVNPLTVLKGYQQLVDEGLVESRRGRALFSRCAATGLPFDPDTFPLDPLNEFHLAVWRLDQMTAGQTQTRPASGAAATAPHAMDPPP